MKELNKKYAAPALERGLTILSLLEKHGALRLEDLSRSTGSPKASLLRYLHTLQELNIIEKINKTYRPLMKLTQTATSSVDLASKVHDTLYKLGERFTVTTEWYDLHHYYHHRDLFIELSQKYEARTCAVSLKAGIGYKRRLNDELEATTRCAVRNLNFNTSHINYWQWAPAGDEIVKQSVSDPESVLEQGKLFYDHHYNINGVRRLAAAVVNPDSGQLTGILCIAEHFRPGNNKTLNQKLEALRLEAEAIESFLKIRNQA